MHRKGSQAPRHTPQGALKPVLHGLRLVGRGPGRRRDFARDRGEALAEEFAEAGEGLGRDMYSLTVEETLAHLDAAVAAMQSAVPA